jgi:putative hemolysin
MTDPSPRPAPRRVSLADYPLEPETIPPAPIEAGRYRVRFARTPRDLDRVLTLRYRIFNLELGEGLDQSHLTGRDEDDLDARFHHLLIETRDGEVVGTYRMQTSAMAMRFGGWYSEQEFTVAALPDEVRTDAVEIGRACVAREHRNGRVIHLLWRGLAQYLVWTRKHWLFGCCSLTSQDPALGRSVHRHLAAIGAIHPSLRVAPAAGLECRGGSAVDPPPHVPALFQSYLSLGARVLGPPAIDRLFKTIDRLVILDTRTIDPAAFRAFFR